jgi:hypothetical protein
VEIPQELRGHMLNELDGEDLVLMGETLLGEGLTIAE